MLECDLIMKGGVTSGVVYPHAIEKIAQEYRLRSIGGTSAGAIAATFAAAAEYKRQKDKAPDSFREIGKVAKELGTNMQSLFQPDKSTRPLFEMLLAIVDPESPGILRAILHSLPRIFPWHFVLGLVLVLAGILLGLITGNWSTGVLVVVVAVLLIAGILARSLFKMVFVKLPSQDFGLCTGKTQQPGEALALGDWMAAKIDSIAGKRGSPLTVGDLREQGIEIAAMTTDLSSQRPYQLPLETKIHYFSKSEFNRIFPEKIVNYLCESGTRREPREEDPRTLPKDLYQLPVGNDFPVFLVARLSLSFPGLICAVPLWRIDYTLSDEQFRRCLFSDGGISSNFPVHFFDHFLPSRPTFGIALDSFHEDRTADRIERPDGPIRSDRLPVLPVVTVPGFLMAILNTAKDWQDRMQAMLPGYAERIVTVRLDDSREGGLNLAMDEMTIGKLVQLGGEAGERLVSEFDFDDQRLDRARTLLPALEGALDGLSSVYDENYSEILTGHRVKPGTGKWRENPFAKFAADLGQIGEEVSALHDDPDSKSVRQGDVPHFDAEVRLVAKADRLPKSVNGEA